jgi:hypothetical protein
VNARKRDVLADVDVARRREIDGVVDLELLELEQRADRCALLVYVFSKRVEREMNVAGKLVGEWSESERRLCRRRCREIELDIRPVELVNTTGEREQS